MLWLPGQDSHPAFPPKVTTLPCLVLRKRCCYLHGQACILSACTSYNRIAGPEHGLMGMQCKQGKLQERKWGPQHVSQHRCKLFPSFDLVKRLQGFALLLAEDMAHFHMRGWLQLCWPAAPAEMFKSWPSQLRAEPCHTEHIPRCRALSSIAAILAEGAPPCSFRWLRCFALALVFPHDVRLIALSAGLCLSLKLSMQVVALGQPMHAETIALQDMRAQLGLIN